MGATVTGTIGTSSQATAFPGLVSAPTVNGIYSSSYFGVKADGVTDDTAAANSIGTFCASIPAGQTAEINYPSNAVSLASGSITTWAQTNCHIYGHGTRLTHPAASTGPILAVKITGGGAYSICPTGVTFTGSGGSAATGTITCTGTTPNIIVSTVKMTANGASYPVTSTTIGFTGGTGTAATALAIINPQIFLSPATGNGTNNLVIDGFILQGNANSTWGVYEDAAWSGGIVGSSLNIINVQDQNTGCYYLPNYELAVSTNLVCSANVALAMGTPQTTTPITGAQFGDINEPVGYFSNNRVVNLRMEHVSGTGVFCSRCQNSQTFVGTSEGNGIGWADTTYSVGNTISMDFESDTVDVNENGTNNIFSGTYSFDVFNILTPASIGTIVGGIYEQITFASLYHNWTLSGFSYNNSLTTSTITNVGPGDAIHNVWNRGTRAILSNNFRAQSSYSTKYWDIYSEFYNTDSDLLFCFNAPGNLAACTPTWGMDSIGNLRQSNNIVIPAGMTGNTQVGYANKMVIAGTIPGVGIDLMTGPATSTANDAVCFADAFGTQEDCGPANIQSTGSQVAGQVACIKSTGPPVVIGTCSGTVNVTTGACGTCN
jgi:hypothetical protein